jgi:probable addiction module antidote protein
MEGLHMTEKFTRWDAVDHLKTEEDMAPYLDACLEEDSGDGSLVRAALNDVARARGMSQLARDTGLTREGLYKALSSSGNPEFSTVLKVIKALGLTLHAAPVIRTKGKIKTARRKSARTLAAALRSAQAWTAGA